MENNSQSNSTSNLLSWLFYALIALMILAIGYRAYKIRQEGANLMDKAAKIEDAVNPEVGYVEPGASGSSFENADTTAVSSSTYSDKTVVESGKMVVDPATGVEMSADEAKSTAGNSVAAVEHTSVQKDEEGVSVKVTDLDMEAGIAGKPDYMVITGSFRKLVNARKSREQLVKKGYAEAEVGKFNRGAYACAIAYRTNSLSEARMVATRLRKAGFPDTFVKEKVSKK